MIIILAIEAQEVPNYVIEQMPIDALITHANRLQKLRAKDELTTVQLNAMIGMQHTNLVANQQEIASLKAQLAEAQKVPDGWKLVPAELTETMSDAAYAVDAHPSLPNTYAHVYRAMLSAAPTYKKE